VLSEPWIPPDLMARLSSIEQTLKTVELALAANDRAIARLRAALEHYADTDSWAVGPTTKRYAWVYAASDGRGDAVARAALAPEEE
jgi:hypothetical protein